jgi:lipopolysaccharide export system protein LptA
MPSKISANRMFDVFDNTHPLIHALLWALLLQLVPAGLAYAEKADRSKPMNAEADALRYDDANRVSVFSGNVVITKGSILIRGDRVEVRQDAQGNQLGVITGTPTQPGFFRQKREGMDEYIEGVANRIEYDSKADQVRFEGRAVLRRYRGSLLADETEGGVITYQNTTDMFSVDGGASSRSASNPQGRVRAMLTPLSNTGASAPVPSNPEPSAPLRPSPTLNPPRP